MKLPVLKFHDVRESRRAADSRSVRYHLSPLPSPPLSYVPRRPTRVAVHRPVRRSIFFRATVRRRDDRATVREASFFLSLPKDEYESRSVCRVDTSREVGLARRECDCRIPQEGCHSHRVERIVAAEVD